MSLHRRAARRDHNEQAIIDALIAAGASVRPWSAKGAPDLCVGYRGVTHLLEVKAPAGPRGGTKHNHAELTGAQIEWRKGWAGAPPVIVRTPAEALAAIGVQQVQEAAGQPGEDIPAPAHASTGRPRPARSGASRPAAGNVTAPQLGPGNVPASSIPAASASSTAREPVDLEPPRVQLRATEEACAQRTGHREIGDTGRCACGKPRLRCSFCSQGQDAVAKLIAGPEVNICDQCVRLCVEIIDGTALPALDRDIKPDNTPAPPARSKP